MAETKNSPKGAPGKQPAQGGEAAQKNGSAATPGEATAKAPAAGINKLEAVRRTLAKLGWEAKPTEIQSHVKKTYGIEMTTDHISTYKADLARKAREAGEPVPQAAPPVKKPTAPKPQASAAKPQTSAAKPPAQAAKKPPAVSPASAAPAQAEGGAGSSGGSILLEDVLTAKQLLDRVGADKLRILLDGLAK
jgi:hypothetical protein